MKRTLIEEAILLDEPIDELPPVEVEVPEIGLDEPEVAPEIQENAISSIIANEISSTYGRIDSLKSVIATISSEMPGKDDVVAIINQLIDEDTVQIGMLQKAMDLIDGKSGELIDAGEKGAEEIADAGSEEPKGEPLPEF